MNRNVNSTLEIEFCQPNLKQTEKQASPLVFTGFSDGFLFISKCSTQDPGPLSFPVQPLGVNCYLDHALLDYHYWIWDTFKIETRVTRVERIKHLEVHLVRRKEQEIDMILVVALWNQDWNHLGERGSVTCGFKHRHRLQSDNITSKQLNL